MPSPANETHSVSPAFAAPPLADGEDLTPNMRESVSENKMSLMQPTKGVSRRRFVILWVVGMLVVLIDQFSKASVRANVPLNGERALIPGWIHLTHVYNYGAAWSLLSGHRWLLIAIAVGVIALVANVAREIAARSTVTACALGFIVGGAVGNLIDRIVWGYVTDFMDFDTPIAWLRTFPIWNLADGALTVGAVLMVLSFLVGMRKTTPTTVPSLGDA